MRPSTWPGPRGDEVQLYRDFAHELRRIVARIVHTEPANVDDACQFAWLQLIRCQPRRETVRPWLIAVARREAIRLHYVTRGHSSLDVGAVVGSTAEPAALVDEFEQALELAEALAALAGLPERKRRFYLQKVLGFSYDEIGVITGDSYFTVNRQLVRGGRADPPRARSPLKEQPMTPYDHSAPGPARR